jgi:excinuclease ABC subunit B
VNEQIERLRLSTMSSLMSRRDVIVVASVSCIYGIGSKEDYQALLVPIHVGLELGRETFLSRLVDMQYNRNDIAFERGQFRVRGDTVELHPANSEEAIRIEFFGDSIDRITRFDPLTGAALENLKSITIFPCKQFVTPQDKLKGALLAIRQELGNGSPGLRSRENCWRRNGSRCARSTTSSSWKNWGFARASRTTPGISRVGLPAPGPIASSTSSLPTTCW